MFLTTSDIQNCNAPKRRIVSVVPSQTELLYSLGLDEEVVGITKFCIHPEKWFRSKKRIGGTKDLKIDEIRKLQPDLIIANKEENFQSQIEELASEFPVFMSDIYNIADNTEMIRNVGLLTGRLDKAEMIISEINTGLEKFVPDSVKRKVLYLIWRAPYMAAGTNTFINSMLDLCGWESAFSSTQLQGDFSRYPELNEGQIRDLEPDAILLSSEPYPFKTKHIEELQRLCPKAQIFLVDGELFSWYGSRLKFSTAHFNAVLERLRYFHAV